MPSRSNGKLAEMTKSELIDYILNRTRKQDWVVIHSSVPDDERTAIHKAVDINLLVRRGNTFDLTEKGHEAIDAGGYDKWTAETKRKGDEIHKAALDSSKATVDASVYAKQSRNVAWVSSVVALFALAFTIYQGIQTAAQDTKITDLQRQLDTLRLQFKAPLQSPKATEVVLQSQKMK